MRILKILGWGLGFAGLVGVGYSSFQRLQASTRRLDLAEHRAELSRRAVTQARAQLTETMRMSSAAAAQLPPDPLVSTGDKAFDAEARKLLDRVYTLRRRFEIEQAPTIP